MKFKKITYNSKDIILFSEKDIKDPIYFQALNMIPDSKQLNDDPKEPKNDNSSSIKEI